MYNKNLKAMLLKFYFIVSFCSFIYSFVSKLLFLIGVVNYTYKSSSLFIYKLPLSIDK